MSEVTHVPVEPDQWHAAFAVLKAEGKTYFDFLAASDCGAMIEVVGHVLAPTGAGRTLVSTLAPAGEAIDTLTLLFPAAAWHEREAFEMVGVRFAGHPDLRPLVLGPNQPPPLRRSDPLAARVQIPWPGLNEPGVDPASTRRRRQRTTPGAQPEWT